jgi:hypothetical protein
MIFTKIGTWVATIGALLSLLNIVLAVVLALDPSQTVMSNTGGTIDLSIYVFGGCLLLGVLSEISKGVNYQVTDEVEDDADEK